MEDEDVDGNDSDISVDSGSSSGPNFNYILNMPLWCLTKEKVEELLKQKDLKVSLLQSSVLHSMIYISFYTLNMTELCYCNVISSVKQCWNLLFKGVTQKSKFCHYLFYYKDKQYKGKLS